MLARGAGMTLADYHTRLSGLMPPQSSTRPTPAQFVDIIAYLSKEAGVTLAQQAPGERWREAAIGRGAKVRPPPKPVFDAPVMAWADWRGSPQGLGYSPAGQIN